MHSFAAIIDSFGGASAFGKAVGILATHARVMKWRDSIPPSYWPGIVRAAADRQVKGVSYEVLAAIAERKRKGLAA